MYFPCDMTFQYFFFDTYLGYFLQMLPLAALTGILHGLFLYRKDRQMPRSQLLFSALFTCYLTGLVGLVLLLDVVGGLWYWLLYGRSSFSFAGTFAFNLVPDFWRHFGSEERGNILLFLPFGILYPLSGRGSTFQKTLSAGLLWIGVIELLQPLFGRAFDINDILLNTAGVAFSAVVFFTMKRMVCRK